MTELLTLIARAVLAAVLFVAGFSKVADPAGSRDAMQQFGVPARLSPALARLTPALEVFAAVGLLIGAAHWAALGSALLIFGFSGAIVANLARGKHPQCHCFGQLHSAPAGVPALIRNGALIGLAVFVWLETDGGAAEAFWEEVADLSVAEVL